MDRHVLLQLAWFHSTSVVLGQIVAKTRQRTASVDSAYAADLSSRKTENVVCIFSHPRSFDNAKDWLKKKHVCCIVDDTWISPLDRKWKWLMKEIREYNIDQRYFRAVMLRIFARRIMYVLFEQATYDGDVYPECALLLKNIKVHNALRPFLKESH